MTTIPLVEFKYTLSSPFKHKSEHQMPLLEVCTTSLIPKVSHNIHTNWFQQARGLQNSLVMGLAHFQPQATSFPSPNSELKKFKQRLIRPNWENRWYELSLTRLFWEESRYNASVAGQRGFEVTPDRRER
jgi:hypothetical protein